MSSTTFSPAVPNRPRTLVIGSALATSGVLMFFGGLFALYFSRRADAMAWGTEWFPEGAIRLPPGGMNMATMALSAITMAWAVYSVINNDRIHSYLAMAITAVMGVAMLNQTVFYFNDIALPIDHSEATTFLFVIVGAHMAMVLVGVFWLGLLLLRALGGQDTSRNRDLVSAAALYWYAAVVVYMVIWLGIYIAK
ncbi:MAG TPA: cytochrome c oxidase subunit 3 [Acidimicrobiales bacterium]|jgi:cytochrome c oxidase subunit 3|nr:cytochrome c oxidase subunit 3 [Acidimicrobiales bacterium]MDP7209524.1 cytochrome c oxidase subunit 3 [Acidimicrobiales bacterium]HJL90033.1 cytochrome c oxidase subunit 3 [Acidimicrobiales bacterium]HJO98326.1 cytochrome c oxidase subunit 3 [Acidimicrobiales bacterium]|tara:strand:+ start:4531 stop:5115 length:585 start_codon:yes stop_codon:yes gene_type:complete